MERNTGIPGTARPDPPGARPTPGATVADPAREAVPPDTVGRSASHVYAVGGKTPAPGCTALTRTERKSGTPGTARPDPPGARPTPGATVKHSDGEAVGPYTVRATASWTYTVTGTNPAPSRAIVSGASATTDLLRADRNAAKRPGPDAERADQDPGRKAVPAAPAGA